MKKKLIKSLFLLLGACSSSGIEPNWDQQTGYQAQAWEHFSSQSPSQNYRIEFRDLQLSQVDQDQAWAAVGSNRARVAGDSQSQMRRGQQINFVNSRAGQSVRIRSASSLYMLALGNAQAGLIEARIATLNDSLGQNTGVQTSTQVKIPLGQWISVASMYENSPQIEQGWEQNQATYQRQRKLQRLKQKSSLEIRITPML